MKYRATLALLISTVSFASSESRYHRLVVDQTKREDLALLERVQIPDVAVQKVELHRFLSSLEPSDGSIRFVVRPDNAEMRNRILSLRSSNLSVASICDLVSDLVSAEWWVSDGVVVISSLKHTEILGK